MKYCKALPSCKEKILAWNKEDFSTFAASMSNEEIRSMARELLDSCYFPSFAEDHPDTIVLDYICLLAYEAEHLPILTEWKSVRSGEYVLGVEPGNSYISGMDNERAHGRVDRIGPFEKRVFRVKLSFSPC